MQNLTAGFSGENKKGLSNRSKKRLERIKEEIPINQVLYDLEYNVYPHMDREQQFACDLHGSGRDNTPSARYYPESNSTYCFGCGQARDSISYIRIKKNLSFSEALTYLEKTYGLEPLPWESDEEEQEDREQSLVLDLFADKGYEDYDDVHRRVSRLLLSASQSRTFPMQECLKFWEKFDRITVLVDQKLISEAKGALAFDRIKQRFLERMGQGD
ncbi:MAG: CHC2 zinc finger domain-containing protein [Bacteroidota bacterium]